MSNNQARTLDDMTHRMSKRPYIAVAAAIFLACVVLLYVYASLVPALVLGAILAGIVLMSLGSEQ